ncbi:MAG: hypothetical protein H6808_11690 [Phycisphaera sp.]|nr:hypothetical protein [Phycisphaera sp.]
MTRRTTAASATLLFALGLGGCAATGLTPEAYEITKAECQASMTHLANTEPEFASLKDQSYAYAVFPGEFSGIDWFLGGAGSDGLVYDKSNEVIGYSRHARVNLGLGFFGQYADFVVFFPDQAALDSFKKGGWSIGGETGIGILGLAASGQQSMTEDRTFVSDPRSGGGLGAYFTFDNFSYNNINDALTN